MSFLLGVFGQLERALRAELDRPPSRPAKPGCSDYHHDLSTATQARYAAAFAEPASATDGAARLGIGPVACYIQLCRYEAQQQVVRLGPLKGGRTVYWQWIGPAPQPPAIPRRLGQSRASGR